MSRISSLVSFSPPTSRVEKQSEDVVLRILVPLVEHRIEVGVDLLGRLVAYAANVLCVGRLTAGSQDPVLQPKKGLEFFPRQTHQTQEHRRGKWNGEFLSEVALTSFVERVDEPIHAGRDVVLQLVHPPRSKERVKDLAVPRVVWRIDTERQKWPNIAEPHDITGREEFMVAEHLVNGFAARHHDDSVHGPQDWPLLEKSTVAGLWFRLIDVGGESFLERDRSVLRRCACVLTH